MQFFRSQEELEDSANKPTSDSATEDEKPNQSIAQVGTANRKRAQGQPIGRGHRDSQ